MIATMENGKMEKLVAREDINHLEALCTVETGKTISKKVKEKNRCQTVLSLKEIIKMELRMAKVCTSSLMDLTILENLNTIFSTVKDSFPGLTENNTPVNGLKTKCMVKVNLIGQMDVYTLVNIIKTSSKAKESSFGQMLKTHKYLEYTKECGWKRNNMESACIPIKKESKSEADGTWVKWYVWSIKTIMMCGIINL